MMPPTQVGAPAGRDAPSAGFRVGRLLFRPNESLRQMVGRSAAL